MKIALFHNLPPGGAKRVVYQQAKLLSKKHHVEIFEVVKKEKDFIDMKDLGIPIHSYYFSLQNHFPGFLNRIASDFKNFYSLKRAHKKIANKINLSKFDIVIVHPDRYTEAPFILKFLKTKTVYYAEECLRIAYEDQFGIPKNLHFIKKTYETITRSIRKMIDVKNITHANVVLTNSKFTKKNIYNAYKINAHVCYLGVDANFFRPVAKKKNSFLFVGAKDPTNGFQLATGAKKLGFDVQTIDTFTYSQFSDIAIVKAYSHSLATLCFGVNEPFGLSALESMSCQTPVIAIKEGGYKETVVNGKTGFLIARDTDELTKKMNLLLENKQILARMGKKAREYVLKQWTWEKHIASLEKYF